MDKKETLQELTFGQVIDLLTPNEVAMSTQSDEYIKLVNKRNPPKIYNGRKFVISNGAIHYNPTTNLLEFYNGRTIYLGYNGNFGHMSKFVIVSREEYEALIGEKFNDKEEV